MKYLWFIVIRVLTRDDKFVRREDFGPFVSRIKATRKGWSRKSQLDKEGYDSYFSVSQEERYIVYDGNGIPIAVGITLNEAEELVSSHEDYTYW